MESLKEWCPRCGHEIITITRGIPSYALCKYAHRSLRTEIIESAERPKIAPRVDSLMESFHLRHDDHTPYAKRPHEVNASIALEMTKSTKVGWLEIKLTETTERKDGKTARRVNVITLTRDEASALRAFLKGN